MLNGIFRQIFHPSPVASSPAGPGPQPQPESLPGITPDTAPPTLPSSSTVTTGDYRSAPAGDLADPDLDVTFGVPGNTQGVFQPTSVTALDMRENRFGGTSYIQHSDPVVPGSSVHDPSEALHESFNRSRTALSRETDSSLSAQIEDPALRERAEQALTGLRTALTQSQQGKQLEVSVNAMLTQRQPPLSDEQVVGILEQTQKMLGTSYDPRTGGSAELALSALHDVAVPSNISQRQEGTCMAGAAQMQIASLQPERYLEMIDTLGRNQNYPEGANPPLLQPNWSFANEQGASLYRTPSVALMQNALIDAMNGENAEFNSAETRMSNGGTNPQDLQRLLPQLLGESEPLTHTRSADAVLAANPSRENPIFVALAWSEKPADQQDDGQTHYYHALNLIGVDRERGQVTLMNPHGYEQSFSIDEFNRRFNQALI
ncbi:MAG: hypothetical protein ACO1RX_19950 [Candidatus Sericytochromatia bacterium]